MYILIITFKADITPDEYEEIAGKDAPIFANILGLKHNTSYLITKQKFLEVVICGRTRLL